MGDLWVSLVYRKYFEENWSYYEWNQQYKQMILYADNGRQTPLYLIWSHWSMQSGITTEGLPFILKSCEHSRIISLIIFSFHLN